MGNEKVAAPPVLSSGRDEIAESKSDHSLEKDVVVNTGTDGKKEEEKKEEGGGAQDYFVCLPSYFAGPPLSHFLRLTNRSLRNSGPMRNRLTACSTSSASWRQSEPDQRCLS